MKNRKKGFGNADDIWGQLWGQFFGWGLNFSCMCLFIQIELPTMFPNIYNMNPELMQICLIRGVKTVQLSYFEQIPMGS